MRAKQFLKLANVKTVGEFLERFTTLPMLKVGAQHALECIGQFARDDSRKDLAADSLVFPKAAAHKDVIAVKGLRADFCFCAEAADVAHIMLGTGIWAAGQVNVHGPIEFDA